MIEKSISINKITNKIYKEKANINYKVYLKENQFYNEKYLKEGTSYISSLIDNFEIKYNYKLLSNKKLKGNYNYSIFGVMEIINQDNNDIFYTKKYKLYNKDNIKIIDNQIVINEKINVSFDRYNDLAVNFREKYGINAISNLKVYLNIEKNIKDDDNKNTDMYINIPLDKKVINVSLNYDKKNKNNEVSESVEYSIKNCKLLFIGIILIIFALILSMLMIYVYNSVRHKLSDYNKLIKKYLKDYDRMIVNVETIPSFDKYDISFITEFNELIDAADSLKRPINFYEIKKSEECYFFVKNDNSIYLYHLKAIDIEKEGEKNEK